MRNKPVILGTVLLTAFVFISGCSFDLSKFTSLLPSRKKAATVSEQVYKKDEMKVNEKTREELRNELNGEINMVVGQINAGNWNEAISIGEGAYNKAAGQGQKSAAVNQAVYDVYGLEAVKEKLYEVLSAAYDFKYHMEGLSKDEKEKYLRTVQSHFNVNPSDPFKKLALAKAFIDTGDLEKGLSLMRELYNSQYRDKDISETYAWALYLLGKKDEAYNLYKSLYPQSETLIQLFHSALVIEEKDKSLGLILYEGCEGAANNLMVKEPNVNNLSAQSYLNRVRTDCQNASDRLLAGGFRLNSQYNLTKIDPIIKSIVKLSAE